MTDDARAALKQAGLSRREFLKGSGALIVTFTALGSSPARRPVSAQGLNGPGGSRGAQLDSWLAIGADGTIVAYTGKCELGTGLYTAQTQLIAEELSVPIGHVRLIQCDTALTPDQGTTSGQQSHPTNFNHSNLALAAATAREALLRLASERFGLPPSQLVAHDGAVGVSGDASRRLTYAALLGGKTSNLPLSPTAKRKHPTAWTVLGTSVPRLDLPALATAQLEFVHNVRLPGMLHGRVVRPPTVGATIVSIDETSANDLPGVVKVFVKNNFVGVVAEKPWPAIQAAAKLKVTWAPGPSLPSHRLFHEHLRAQTRSRDSVLVDSGDVDGTLSKAASVVKATYFHPYQMHGSLGTSCAVADVQGTRATLWSPTQAVYPQRNTAAMILGIPPENVHVIYSRGSGCYGINGADTVTFDAALLSQAVGRPVRVQLSRKDEMAWENYGFAFLIDQRAAVDKDGTLVAWDYEAWSPGLGGRPGYDTPGNVITGSLVGFAPAAPAPRSPAPPPTDPLNNSLNTAPSYIAGCVRGECRGAGTVRSERLLSHRVTSAFFTGPLRSPERLQNTFAHECFLDEVAAHVKADPVEYRLRHLSHRRLSEAVRRAAAAAGWDARPSPKPGLTKSEVATGRGIACVAYEGDNGYVAIVAEVEVNRATGGVKVRRLVAAADCGPISNPDGIRNQIEGGALHGMSRALMEEVTWDDQQVTSIDWRTYRTFPVGFEVPRVEVVLLNQVDEEAMGAGETAITIAGAAIGNAIFDATGARLRQMPFTPERLKAALA
jgi:CO/xanthine dehydrogenase Mo-binding subunit